MSKGFTCFTNSHKSASLLVLNPSILRKWMHFFPKSCSKGPCKLSRRTSATNCNAADCPGIHSSSWGEMMIEKLNAATPRLREIQQVDSDA